MNESSPNPAESEIKRILPQLELLVANKSLQDLGILLLLMKCYRLEEKDIELEKDIEELLEEKNIRKLVKGKFEKLVIEEDWLKRDLDKENGILTELRRKIKLQNRLLEELKRLLQEAEARKARAVAKAKTARAGEALGRLEAERQEALGENSEISEQPLRREEPGLKQDFELRPTEETESARRELNEELDKFLGGK